MLTKLKQRAQSWLTSEAALLHRLGLTPNHVSILGLVLALLSAVTYWQWQLHPLLLIVAPLLMLASGLLDALDGAIARIYGEATKFGGFFDSLLDRYADAVILCGIILGGLTELSLGACCAHGQPAGQLCSGKSRSSGSKNGVRWLS